MPTLATARCIIFRSSLQCSECSLKSLEAGNQSRYEMTTSLPCVTTLNEILIEFYHGIMEACLNDDEVAVIIKSKWKKNTYRNEKNL